MWIIKVYNSIREAATDTNLVDTKKAFMAEEKRRITSKLQDNGYYCKCEWQENAREKL